MRRASSMIELVIAIVVMGIAMMTLPLMLEKVQSSNTFAMQQEALLAARTQLGDITTYPWDENSLKSNIVAILDVNSTLTPVTLQRDSNTSLRRVGHVFADKRRKFFDPLEPNNAATTPANLGIDAGGNIDDIDDFANTTTNLLAPILAETTDTGLDYKFDDLNMSIFAHYISDAANYSLQDMATFTFPTPASAVTNGSTNIKLIELRLSGTGLDNNITFRTYATNIGESEILRRDF